MPWLLSVLHPGTGREDRLDGSRQSIVLCGASDARDYRIHSASRDKTVAGQRTALDLPYCLNCTQGPERLSLHSFLKEGRPQSLRPNLKIHNGSA